MAIVFSVLGFGLIAGGGWLIVDGWPFLVLERGFTQVISGTVTAVGGLVMLGLARVLSELRGMRGLLKNALMAVSVATLTSEDRPASWNEPARGEGLPGGALAGAAAAAGLALVRPDLTTKEDPTEPPALAASAPDARDGDDARAPEAEPAPVDHDIADAASAPEADGLDAELGRLRFTDREFEPEAAPEPEIDQPRAPPDWLDPRPDDRDGAARTPEFDFDRLLRERLADDINAPPVAADEIRVPALEPDDRERLDAATDWLSSFRPSRERWGGDEADRADEAQPAAGDLAPAEPAPEPDWLAPAGPAPEPDWLAPAERDRRAFEETADIAASEPLPAYSPEPEPEPESGPEADRHEEAPALPEAASTDFGPEPEPTPEPDPAEHGPPAPAASEEGVVGAYQVGAAHFTIYADGSIQARTPDGDFSFGSMDELKSYLASEKSRLGV